MPPAATRGICHSGLISLNAACRFNFTFSLDIGHYASVAAGTAVKTHCNTQYYKHYTTLVSISIWSYVLVSCTLAVVEEGSKTTAVEVI